MKSVFLLKCSVSFFKKILFKCSTLISFLPRKSLMKLTQNKKEGITGFSNLYIDQRKLNCTELYFK